MVRGIRLAKTGELIGMCLPIEVATIYDATSHAGRMAIHVFRSGMRHDVSAPLKRATVDRCSEGVVHDQGYAVAMCDAGKLLDVKHHHTRIRDGLTKQQFRVGAEGLADLLFAGILIDEGTFNAQLLQSHRQQVVGTSINAGRTDDVIARLADIEEGKETGSLTRSGQDSAHASFQSSDLSSYGIIRRVLQTGIEITTLL